MKTGKECLVVLFTTLTVTAAPIRAQTYTPSYETPQGAELVAVFISTSTCTGNAVQWQLDTVIRNLKVDLAKRAKSAGMGFAAVGVATEWSVSDGLAYLLEGKTPFDRKNFGEWDEVSAGRNWLGVAASQYIWMDSEGQPMVPQLVIIRRTVRPHGGRIVLGPEIVLQRLAGAKSIVTWAAAGAPLPKLGQSRSVK